ncbi:alpha-crystallin A chain-like [Sipha flava]|uniref:Alpha-crystallin A chain-like n=2 Tax=Sipha flava TaxID=143950 RepID=A0A8B8F9D3_9HEMI|nr:alpha-crystallin A chain-like [Sipha flava]
MSILPYLLDELSRPTMYDQNFGLGLLDDDLLLGPRYHGRSHFPVLLKSYLRPHRLSSAAQSGLSCIQNDKNNFKVNLDVQQFKPEEVSVKVVDGYVVVEGKHEERSDEHGYISRQFTRRYKVPDNVDSNSITSTLSSDGVLSVGAPKKIPEKSAGERPIQIVQTNQPSIKQSSNKDEKNYESMETNQ